MKTTTCPRCLGTGRSLTKQGIVDLVAQRVSAGISQFDLSVKMGVSATYLCDLEHGRRDWTEQLRRRYLKAINGKSR